MYIESAFGRLESYKSYLGVSYFARLPNAIEVANMSTRLVNYVGRDIIAWILSTDTLAVKERKQYFDPKRQQKK
jgi:hypothetical protein